MPVKSALTDEDLRNYLAAGLSHAHVAALYRLKEAVVMGRTAALDRADTARERLAQVALSGRPSPPGALIDPLSTPDGFEPALDLWDWAQRMILADDSALHNPDHAHLMFARVGILWTSAFCKRQGRRVAGMAEIPSVQGNAWLRARTEWQLARWFGAVPDFLITLDAPLAAEADDAGFCALLEHELYHCAQAVDEFGGPRFNREGTPVFAIRGHDVEEHIGVVARYGASAASAGVAEMVRAAARTPLLTAARIARACGTCQH